MLSIVLIQMDILSHTSSSPSNLMSLHVFGLDDATDASRAFDSLEMRAFFAVETSLSVVFNASGPGSMTSDLRFVGIFE
jgi:hypothetical protein